MSNSLSLANDSNQLLERLICILPKDPNQPWHSMDDAYGSKLWDIIPQETNIAGVGHDDTILLDGCRAGNVRWKSFSPVAYDRIESWKRWLAKRLLHSSGLIFWIAIVLATFIPPIGIPLLLYAIVILGLSPWLLRIMYLGKFWGTQAWFFGFEGYMDLDAIERQIFGGRLGRMSWSVNASPLSRHYKNVNGECIGLDPTLADPTILAMVEKAKRAMPGEQRVSNIPYIHLSEYSTPQASFASITLIFFFPDLYDRRHSHDDGHFNSSCPATGLLCRSGRGRRYAARHWMQLRLDDLHVVPRDGYEATYNGA